MFITRRNQAVPVIADDLEYKSLLGAPNYVESNNLIIDLYLIDCDSLRCLFVDRLQVFLPFVMSSRMKEIIISRDDPHYIVRIALVFEASQPQSRRPQE